MPGPGAYTPAEPREFIANVKGNSAFVEDSSSVLRRPKHEMPGPGEYPLPSSIDPKKGIKSAFQWQGERGKSKATAAPGPAYYEQKTLDDRKSFHWNIRKKFVP
jgi:hypothetical protein